MTREEFIKKWAGRVVRVDNRRVLYYILGKTGLEHGFTENEKEYQIMDPLSHYKVPAPGVNVYPLEDMASDLRQLDNFETFMDPGKFWDKYSDGVIVTMEVMEEWGELRDDFWKFVEDSKRHVDKDLFESYSFLMIPGTCTMGFVSKEKVNHFISNYKGKEGVEMNTLKSDISDATNYVRLIKYLQNSHKVQLQDCVLWKDEILRVMDDHIFSSQCGKILYFTLDGMNINKIVNCTGSDPIIVRVDSLEKFTKTQMVDYKGNCYYLYTKNPLLFATPDDGGKIIRVENDRVVEMWKNEILDI